MMAGNLPRLTLVGFVEGEVRKFPSGWEVVELKGERGTNG